jgi:hypothetical protein
MLKSSNLRKKINATIILSFISFGIILQAEGQKSYSSMSNTNKNEPPIALDSTAELNNKTEKWFLHNEELRIPLFQESCRMS